MTIRRWEIGSRRFDIAALPRNVLPIARWRNVVFQMNGVLDYQLLKKGPATRTYGKARQSVGPQNVSSVPQTRCGDAGAVA